MKTFVYMINTWLLALGFLPFSFMFADGTLYWGGLEMVVTILLLGFVFSILPLFLSSLFLQRILLMGLSVEFRMLVWLLTVCFSIFISAWFLGNLIGVIGWKGLQLIAFPAMISALVSVLIRYPQFRILCKLEDAGKNAMREEEYGT